MTMQVPTKHADPMTTTHRRRNFNPFSAIFSSLCNLILWLFKLRPSTLQLENSALRKQLELLDAAMERENHRNIELKKLNSTSNETVMTLQAKSSEMQAVLEQREDDICKGKKLVVEHKERVGILEKELQIIEKKKCVLQERVNEQNLLLESKIREWTYMVDAQNQKNCSLQDQLDKQCQMEEDHAWHITAWETVLEHSREFAEGLKSKKETLKKKCSVLKQENLQLKDACKRLRSENRDRIASNGLQPTVDRNAARRRRGYVLVAAARDIALGSIARFEVSIYTLTLV